VSQSDKSCDKQARLSMFFYTEEKMWANNQNDPKTAYFGCCCCCSQMLEKCINFTILSDFAFLQRAGLH